jgi:putative Mg2+ transporter-C (MgtC) family protein
MENLTISLLLNIVKILVTILCIYLINLPRQNSSGPVHSISLQLIGIGSCLFMMVAVTLSPLVISQPQQVAGNVMLGMIIFGIIVMLKNKFTAQSITAVVLIWVSGAVGMAVGSGLFMEAILVTFLTYFLLNLLIKNIYSEF